MYNIKGYRTKEDMTPTEIAELGQCYTCILCRVNPYSSYCTKNADINKYSRTTEVCPYKE